MRKFTRGLISVLLMMLLLAGVESAFASSYVLTENFDNWIADFGNTSGLNTTDFTYGKQNVSSPTTISPVTDFDGGTDGTDKFYRVKVTGTGTANGVKPYVTMELRDKTKANIGENGTAVLEFDFAFDTVSNGVFMGGEMLTTTYDMSGKSDFASAAQDSYGKYNSASYFLKITTNEIMAFGTTYALPRTLSAKKWYHLTVAVNADNTYTLAIDDTTIAYNKAMESFKIRYYYTNTSGTKTEATSDNNATRFRGFRQPWILYYSDASTNEQGYFLDDITFTNSTEKIAQPNVVFTEDFNSYTGGTSLTVPSGFYKSFSSDSTYYTSAIGKEGADDLSLALTANDNTRPHLVLGVEYYYKDTDNVAKLSCGDNGAVELSMDFKLGSNTYATLEGYVRTNNTVGSSEYPYYTAKYTGSGTAFLKIESDRVLAWGKWYDLTEPLSTGSWHNVTMCVNSDNTFNLYFNDELFLANEPMEDFKVTYYDTSSTSTNITSSSDEFRGFSVIWLRHYLLDTANSTGDNTVYHDNLKLSLYDSVQSLAPTEEDTAKVNEAAANLKIYTEHVENGLALDTVGVNNTTISWASSNTDVITNYGVVYPTVGKAEEITMTATISYKTAKTTKTFDITVPAVQNYVITGVKITGSDGIEDTALVGGKTVSKVSIKRYQAENNEINVLLALYQGGVLKDVSLNPLTPSVAQYAYGDLTLTDPMVLPQDITDYTMKVMIWDDMETLLPLSDVFNVSPIVETGITLYTAGDSTVQYYNPEYYAPREGWGMEIGNFLTEANITVNNKQPEGGRSAKSFIAENRLNNILETIKPGDYLLVQFGHNDYKTDSHTSSVDGTKISRNTSIDGNYNSYMRYLEIYVDAARDKGANVILISPANRCSMTDSNLMGYPKAMDDFAKAKNVPIVDLTASSVELLNSLNTNGIAPENLYMVKGTDTWNSFETFGSYISAEDFVNDYTNDTTHFNSVGAQCISQLIAEGLKDIGSPLSRLVKSDYTDVINNLLGSKN